MDSGPCMFPQGLRWPSLLMTHVAPLPDSEKFREMSEAPAIPEAATVCRLSDRSGVL